MATGIVIVKQYEKMVVFSLGKYTGSLKGAGFHFLVPFFYYGKVVDTREVPERVPTQQYITKDNVVVDMDFVLYYRVLPEQAEKSVLEVADHRLAVRNLAVAELRSIIGNITLAEALGEREQIQSRLQMALDENTGRWGVKGARGRNQRDRPTRGGEDRHGEGEVGGGHQDGRYHRVGRTTPGPDKSGRGGEAGGHP